MNPWRGLLSTSPVRYGSRLKPSMCTRKDLSPAVWPCFSFSTISGSPAAARKVGSQSWCWMISLEITPAGILPGQRTISGTRKAPSQLVFFSLRNGVIPPSGQLFMWGPLSVE